MGCKSFKEVGRLDLLNQNGDLFEDDVSQQDPIYANLFVPRLG